MTDPEEINLDDIKTDNQTVPDDARSINSYRTIHSKLSAAVTDKRSHLAIDRRSAAAKEVDYFSEMPIKVS